MNSSFEHFPLEIVQLILAHIDTFKDLCQCSLINKLFNAATLPKLWRSPMKRQLDRPFLNTTSLVKRLDLAREKRQLHLIPLGNHIRHAEFHMDSIQDILKVLEHAPLVESLLFVNTDLSNADMDQLAQLCPRLQYLEFTYVYITDQSMASFGRHCPHLRSLCLWLCPKLTDKAFFHLGNCPLEHIEISCCGAIKPSNHLGRFEKLDYFRRTNHSDLTNGQFLHQQQQLQLQLQLEERQPTVLWPLLKELEVPGFTSNDTWMDDALMIPFIESHPHLESLTLTRSRIGNASLMAMAKHLPDLRRLYLDDISNLSSQVVRQLVKECLHLVYVSLVDCDLPRRCFPETGLLPRLMDTLGLDDIKRIRLDSTLIFTEEDDKLHESDNDDNGDNDDNDDDDYNGDNDDWLVN